MKYAFSYGLKEIHKICTEYSEIFKIMQNTFSKINSQSSEMDLTHNSSNDWIQNKSTFY